MSTFEGQNTLRATEKMKSVVMWQDVEAKINDDLGKKDIEQVAHTIACSWWGSDDPEDPEHQYNLDKARQICTDPRLVPYHEKLWANILEDNGENWDHKDIAYKKFTEEYGWDI